MEYAAFRTDPAGLTPERLKGFFAEVLSALDGRPRQRMVEVDLREVPDGAEMDMEDGEPVFRTKDGSSVRASFRRRYLAEHPVPLALPGGRRTRLVLTPTTGNRVKARGVRPFGLDRLLMGW